MLKKYGYVRVGAIVNELKIADVFYNVTKTKECLLKALNEGVEIVTFPELSLTGYTCQDLFLNADLLKNVLVGLADLKEFSKNKAITFIVGAPLQVENSLYNCAVVFSDGHILGIVPKTYVPNYGEYYEGRYFASASKLKEEQINLCNEIVPISNTLIFHAKNYSFVHFAIEVCEDLWVSNSPSNFTTMMGANIIFNLSASNEQIGKCEYRKELVKMAASKNICAYVYSSSGLSESTSDLLFSGHAIIAEASGEIIENERFSFTSSLIYQDVDLFRINHDRILKKGNEELHFDLKRRDAYFNLFENKNTLCKKYLRKPFVTEDPSKLEEILNLQSYALAKRIKHLGKTKMVIGISGGLDSTLAFLVCLRVKDILAMPKKDIIAITMPGFGTSNRTYNNAKTLIARSGVTFKEISIKDACIQHYKDIDHALDKYDVTYENAQARERTQILFDYANQVGGIVVGTGDLSEIALGFATYNGDHMSNYGVNSSIPKTLVSSLIAKAMNDETDEEIKKVLADILATPISPELLPLADGNIAQKSENVVGPYELQDFFLYHFMRYGAQVKKLYFIACNTFELDSSEIKKTLTIFIKRFFTQQFKRNAMPDGIKVGSISLSPRGDLRLSSDTNYEMYLKELEEI